MTAMPESTYYKPADDDPMARVETPQGVRVANPTGGKQNDTTLTNACGLMEGIEWIGSNKWGESFTLRFAQKLIDDIDQEFPNLDTWNCQNAIDANNVNESIAQLNNLYDPY